MVEGARTRCSVSHTFSLPLAPSIAASKPLNVGLRNNVDSGN
ncbi:hypothetical protein PFLU3_17910 [Pseudomonas fluorescens]|uniref:Uncharacterized protein n=1 Tax=Pseudomonas fluorescens TaxID=294 RepID=A0A0D0RT37_PSEFL|nr:hypothetical protein PFLU3_17910 [Pseudomonas fluorescens]